MSLNLILDILTIISILVAIIASTFVIVDAFNNSKKQGLLTLFIPFYIFYYFFAFYKKNLKENPTTNVRIDRLWLVSVIISIILILRIVVTLVIIDIIFSEKAPVYEKQPNKIENENTNENINKLVYDFGQKKFRIEINPKVGQTNSIFVMTKIAIIYNEDDDALGMELENRKSQIIDMIKSIIAKKDPDDLINLKYRKNDLNTEIIAAINPLFGGKYEILGIYMPDFKIIEIEN